MGLSGCRAALVAIAFSALTSTGAIAAEATSDLAGTLRDGTPIKTITLSNGHGIRVSILTYGATLQSLIAPDRNGHPADIVLGYDDLASYVDRPNYFGVTVGRYANRIAAGRFDLDGKTYQLPLNDNGNSLHGGGKGFDKAVWQIESIRSGPAASVVLSHRSSDGDSGYPGNLTVTVTYSLDEHGNLGITFDANTDRPTVVNLTNHAIFNLAGEGSAHGATGHVLTIPAKAFTPVDATLIPTGSLRRVEGTVFDFRHPRIVADGIRDGRDEQIRFGKGYDHNFALDKGMTATPQLAARLEDPASGRVLEVLSTEPGLQLYTGNFLDGTNIGKNGHLYRMGDGIALEPQKFPDAPNKTGFVSARVDPGKPYRHVMIYRLSTAR
jgi:aldose 1-epimerase